MFTAAPLSTSPLEAVLPSMWALLTGFPNHSKKGIRLLMQLIQPPLMLLSQRILPIKQMALLPTGLTSFFQIRIIHSISSFQL